MKKSKLFTTILAAATLLFSGRANAQATWNVPPAGSTTASYFGTTNANDVIINAGGTTSAYERMRILGSGTNAGFVGIGTASPSTNLHVAGSSLIGVPTSYTGSAYALSVQKCLYGGIGGGHGTVATFNLNSAGSCGNQYNAKVLDFNTPGGAWTMGSGYFSGSQYVSSAWKYYFSVSGIGEAFFGDHTGVSAPPAQLTVNGTAIIGNPALTTPNAYTSTNTGGYSLYVAGGILTEKVKVASHTDGTNWADFVFDKGYKLRSLNEVETYINANKHLPEIPSADEVCANGIDLAQMDAKLLQKIEELTLYMIEMKKENDQLKKDIEALKSK